MVFPVPQGPCKVRLGRKDEFYINNLFFLTNNLQKLKVIRIIMKQLSVVSNANPLKLITNYFILLYHFLDSTYNQRG
jgi:hypothetical protein